MSKLISKHGALLVVSKRMVHEADGLFKLATDQIVNTGDGWVCKSCGMEMDSNGGHKDDCCARRILDMGLAIHALEEAIATTQNEKRIKTLSHEPRTL